jgi:hypothetical protein
MGLLQNGEIGKNFNFFDSELVSFSCDNKKNFSLKQAPSSKIEIFCHFATVPLSTF